MRKVLLFAFLLGLFVSPALADTPVFVEEFVGAFQDSIETQVVGFLGLIVLIGAGWQYRRTGDTLMLFFGAAGLVLIVGSPYLVPVFSQFAQDIASASTSGGGTP